MSHFQYAKFDALFILYKLGEGWLSRYYLQRAADKRAFWGRLENDARL